MKEAALLHSNGNSSAGNNPAQMKTILAPVDFSEDSMFAFRHAILLAQKFGGKAIALHVVGNPVVYPAFTREDEQEFIDHAQQKLYAACRAAARKLGDFETMIRVGVESVAEEINRAAHDIEADLIVVPANRHTVFGRILFGDTVEKMARQAVCPVLMVPVPQWAGQKAEDCLL